MSRAVAAADRVPNDARNTPRELALACCRTIAADVIAGARSPRILEPSAGQGAFVYGARQVFAANASIDAVDLKDYKNFCTDAGADRFLQASCTNITAQAPSLPGAREWNGYDLIVGNPPFTFAEEHVRALFPLLAPGGRLAFLLRINFYGSLNRVGEPPAVPQGTRFWKDFPEDVMYPIVPRPSFGRNKDGKKGTDGTEYALFIWRRPIPDSAGINFARRFRGDHIEWSGAARIEDALTGTFCPANLEGENGAPNAVICGLKQYENESGYVCAKGHGFGAPNLPDEPPALALPPAGASTDPALGPPKPPRKKRRTKEQIAADKAAAAAVAGAGNGGPGPNAQQTIEDVMQRAAAAIEDKPVSTTPASAPSTLAAGEVAADMEI